jgi:hypothetical protein
MPDAYTEKQAAAELGITLARLYQLLDQYIFNEGQMRPPDLEFNANDLLLLEYWNSECAAEPVPDNVVSIRPEARIGSPGSGTKRVRRGASPA